MDRRTLLVSMAGSLLVAPRVLLAQPRDKVWRIGYLTPAHGPAGPAEEAELVEWFSGSGKARRRVQVETRAADDDLARLPVLAAELVRARVDIIVAVSPPAIRAASKATKDIPIVMAFWGGAGLLESGIIRSFARPGTNVTGVYILAAELDVKRLELLSQALPNARRIAILNPGPQWEELPSRRSNTALPAKVDLRLTQVPDDRGYGPVFDSMAKDRIDAVLVPSFPRFAIEHTQIIDAAARHRIPAVYEWGDISRAGGFMAYGPVSGELSRDVARYVDRIAKGARPGDLAVEQPTKFELVVNLATAKALGVSFPQSVLVRADEVVQ